MSEEEKTIKPLYEEVERSIYYNFTSLKRQNALLQVAKNSTQTKFALQNFRQKFMIFYVDVCTEEKISKLNKSQKKYIKDCYYDNNRIKNKRIASTITLICRELIEKLGITNAHVILDDGSMGFQEKSPYDRIIITAACPEIPLPLIEQLAENGLIIAPVGGMPQSLVLLKKTAKGIVEIKNQPNYVFVPLVGKFGQK